MIAVAAQEMMEKVRMLLNELESKQDEDTASIRAPASLKGYREGDLGSRLENANDAECSREEGQAIRKAITSYVFHFGVTFQFCGIGLH